DRHQPSKIAHVASASFRRFRRGVDVELSAPPRRIALPTTMIEDADIAIASMRGVTYPEIAMGTNSTLYATASPRFCLTKRAACLATTTVCGTAARLDLKNTKSAALRPMSAAVEGAIDTWAAASAGASFNPSPTIMARRP